jgi:hypothetical protein
MPRQLPGPKNMTCSGRGISFVATCSICCVLLCSVAHAQNTPPTPPAKPSAPALIQQMAGNWNVEQRMWPGAGAQAINLPPAVAHRRLVEGAYLEEIMEPAQKSGQESFSRTAYFNYNPVNQQYEYFSLDSRAPQMMNERSNETEGPWKSGKGGIKLYGGSFVAPRWGDATNVAFMYRLTVGDVEKDRQVVQLYLTPQAGASPKEFLAFEYVYTRQR